MKITNQFVIPAAIIGSSLVLSALCASLVVMNAQSQNNVLSVTGSAKESIKADSATWRITVSRKAREYEMAQAYPLVNNDSTLVQDFLAKNKIAKTDITINSVLTEEIYNYSGATAGPREYNVRQEIIVRSSNVDSIDKLSKDIVSLASRGVFIQGNSVEYTVSDLAGLRVSLLADAIRDARARASELAKAGGSSVGALKSASSGVVQVLAPNSIEVSDYGSYDTQSIEKEVMVTARASFYVR